MMAISWAIIALNIDSFSNWFSPAIHGLVDGFSNLAYDAKMHLMEETLLHHLGKTAEILVFLIGAMTIVEIIDYFNGFSVIKDLIKISRPKANEKVIFVWPEGIIPGVSQNELIEYQWLFTNHFNDNHILALGINNQFINNDLSDTFNSFSIHNVLYDIKSYLLLKYFFFNLLP